MNNLEGKTEVVGKLFSSDFFFRIPDYQRPFAWEQDNFTDLIDDLTTAQGDQQYFLGTLVLHKTDSKNNYDVVDGQQRLTTLIILFACLRDLINDPDYKKQLQGKINQEENKVDSIPEKPRIDVKDRAIFRELILTDNGTKTDKKEKDLVEPEVRYLQAIHIFIDKLKDYNQEELEKFIKFVNQKCVVIYLATSSFDDAFKLFTIVNDRGRQLRRIDILKAQNISPDAVPIPATRDKISKEWENLENDLGESILESVLSMIRMIYIKEKPIEDIFGEFEKRIFRKGLISRGEKFVDVVKQYGKLYQQIFIDKDFIENVNSDYLKYRSLIHIMDSEFSASEWRACVLSFSRKFNDDSFLKFLLLIEKVYLEAWTKEVRKDERFSIYSSILKTIEASETVSEVLSSIKYSSKPILNAIVSKNFYKSRYSKYFLLRLEILASENDALKEFNARSIEHVFPQNPAKDSEWRKDKNIRSLQSVVHTIGNLVLLSKGKNSSASNLEFEKKKEKYLKERVSDYPRSIQILGENEWSVDKIRQRNQEIQTMILNDI